jgi:outer membrane receptor protein involved in Fe transport
MSEELGRAVVHRLIFSVVVLLCVLCTGVGISAETPEGMGVLSGLVVDRDSGEGLIDAGIEVQPLGKKGFTDLDGRFSMELPAGKYDVRVFYPMFNSKELRNITIKPGETNSINVTLVPQEGEMTVVEVVESAEKAAEATQILLRKRAAAVTDRISAEAIARIPASDAAEILTKVTGVSVVNKKYVYVRGLGDRYSKTTLNNLRLPSPEPEKKIVPMDLFPSETIKSINVVKSYTPDLPGEFSGGLVQIETKDHPDAFQAKISVSTGYNSETTGRDFKTYNGGDWDWLGFDDGSRQIPDEIPAGFVRPRGIVGTGGYTQEEIIGFARSFENVWNPRTKTAGPPVGLGFMIGDKLGRFGYLGTLNYSHSYQTKTDEQRTWYRTGFGGRQSVYADFDFDTYEEKVNYGGLLNFGLELSPYHRIAFKNFYNRKSEDSVREYAGFHDTWGDDIYDRRLRWWEEELYQGQLRGEHYFDRIKSDITWRVGFSESQMEEPDLREVQYWWDSEAQTTLNWLDGPQSGTRFFGDLYEDRFDVGLDWKVDGSDFLRFPAAFAMGISYYWRERDFDYRRFSYVRGPGILDADIFADPETLFAPENFKARDGFILRETTRPTDSYNATERNEAAYGMLDFTLFDRLRVVGGVRVEADDLEVVTFNPFTPRSREEDKGVLEDDDTFPAVNVVYSVTDDMNLRFSYSQTVNRPQFRELSSFEYTDVAETESVVGNPDLVTASLHNYDLRWEWFVGADELLAMSFFYKDISKPIERVQEPTSAGLRRFYINAASGEVLGFELEVRKHLGFIHSSLENLMLGANYTYTDSEVKLGPDITPIMTNSVRPMNGQSDNLANIVLDYTDPDFGLTVKMLYNYVGRRLDVGAAYGLPDIYEESGNWLDFVAEKRLGTWNLRFTAKNLLDEDIEFTQGGETYRKYKEGISLSLGLSKRF